MTNHPITPSPELVEQWADASARTYRENGTYAQHEFEITTQAARWGADMELEACCEYVYERLKLTTAACITQELRAARRPKPPTLKEQALNELADVYNADKIDDHTYDTILKALEALAE